MDPSRLTVRLIVRDCGDRFVATSPDVPGLHVCGKTLPDIYARAQKGVKTLLEKTHGMRIAEVSRTGEVGDLLVRLAAGCLTQ